MADISSNIPENLNDDNNLVLIPNLPNDLSSLILSYIPFPFHVKLKSICKSWYNFYSSKIPQSIRYKNLRNSCLSHLLCVFPEDPSLSSPCLFDPTHLAWAPLPHMPVINPSVYSLSNFAALSIGAHLYVLGGSHFDARAFPIDRPVASASVFRYDLRAGVWATRAPMRCPRGSLAAAVAGEDRIVVAGGGSRHAIFGAAGTRVGSAEAYDVERDEWFPLADLPGSRAGCAGFCVGGGREFWVMGGYGGVRTINGVLPVDEDYKDVVVMEMEDGGVGRWRLVGDMWGDQERARLGKVVVIDNDDNNDDDDDDHKLPGVFMLDGNDIFRYNMASNRWFKESIVPRKNKDESPFGFVALRGELHVISLLQGSELSAIIRRSRHRMRGAVLFMQIYNPKDKSWRSLVTRTPFGTPLDFKTTVMCTIRV